MNKLKVMSVALSPPQPSLFLYLIWDLDNDLDYQVIYKLLVCTWHHGGHVDGQEQKHFSPLGTKLHFSYEFFEKKFYCIDPQHGHLVTWLQTKNTSVSPNELSVNQSSEEIRRVEYKISEDFIKIILRKDLTGIR